MDGDGVHGSGTSLVFDEEHRIIKVGNLLGCLWQSRRCSHESMEVGGRKGKNRKPSDFKGQKSNV